MLRARETPLDDGKCTVIFTVKDTGIGIPEEELPKIYDIFYRAGNAYSHSVQGTGIGLAVVKELTEKMGGRISVESELGTGTEFTVAFSQEVSEEACPGVGIYTDVHYLAPDCHVLVVDDNPDNLEMVRILLERTMLKMDTAESGEEGIRYAAKNHYDIVVLDYMMPDMDGIETLKRMKEQGTEAVFIVLTADAVKGTDTKMYEAGFDEYVTKPVDWRKFEELLLKHLPKEKIAYMATKRSLADSSGLDMLNDKTDHPDIDPEYGLKRVDYSLEMYRNILLLFMDNHERNYSRANEMYEAGDFENLCIIVHSLRSQALGIGGMLLSKMAAVMEERLKKDDTEYVKSAFLLLQLEWNRTNSQAELIADMLCDEPEESGDREAAESESIEEIRKRAVYALNNNMWLDARDAVIRLKKTGHDTDRYNEILELTENFDFRGALEKLEKEG